MSTTYIYGRHAVKTLLEITPERVEILFLNSTVEPEFKPLAREHGIRVEELTGKNLSRELEGAVHQGVVARVTHDGLMINYADYINTVTPTPSVSLVLLNEITDPHNVGAIIRSAAAFGASAVLIPSHNQSPITGAVAKASAGTVFSIPIIAINNENHTIIDLKERGFWIYGLAGEGKNQVAKEPFDAPAVFVIGSEGDGLRLKTREHCDILLKIPMHPDVESLNASVSAAVVLSAWSNQHPEALHK